jgi:hypothetical protein
MIPAPNHQRSTADYGYTSSDTPRRPLRVRRRSSSPASESSTRTSELDLLNIPPQYASKGYEGDRLSVIPEANSAEGTPSQMTMTTASTPVGERQPSIREVSGAVLERTSNAANQFSLVRACPIPCN